MTDSRTPAAVLVDLGRPLVLEELILPALQPGQVLVRVAYSGVCHTQLLEARGKRGPDKFLPHTLGHEGSGTVTAIGAGVTKVRPGDRVVLTWIKGTGADIPSTRYGSRLGAVNSGAISTLLEHAVVSENRTIPIAQDFPLREAALLGCAVPTGVGILTNTAQARPGATVAVFGAGGIGLSAILGARLVGARAIIAVDVVDHKLEQAKALGATHLVNARGQDALDAVREATQGRGVDVAVEAAGRRETMEAAFASVRDGGGLCVIAGNLPAGERISLNPMDLIRGKRIVGTWGGESHPDRDVPRLAELHRRGELQLERLVTHTYPLGDVNRAFDDLEAGQVGRALICNDLR